MARDRHARLQRADGDARRRPADGFRARDRGRFRRLVREAVSALPPPAVEVLAGAALVVRDVPAGVGEDVPVTFGRDVPLADAEAEGTRIRRLVVYRRPVELRADDRYDLVDLLRDAVLEAAADALGADPDDWDET